MFKGFCSSSQLIWTDGVDKKVWILISSLLMKTAEMEIYTVPKEAKNF